jgi:hypothetical protein
MGYWWLAFIPYSEWGTSIDDESSKQMCMWNRHDN